MPTAPQPRRERKLTGWHVVAMLGGFFGVIFVVNGIFLFEALATHSGGVESDPYRTGLHYNARIAEDQRQQALGWTENVKVGFDSVAVTLQDRSGAPVTGLAVEAVLGRPSTARMDKTLKLQETAPGIYRAPLSSVDEGAWIIDVEASKAAGGDPVYRSRNRIWLKS